jgi:hypothetical protein
MARADVHPNIIINVASNEISSTAAAGGAWTMMDDDGMKNNKSSQIVVVLDGQQEFETNSRTDEKNIQDGVNTPAVFMKVAGKIPVYFQEDWAAGIGGGLWSTGRAMASYFSDHSDTLRKQLLQQQKQKGIGLNNQNAKLSALELGSGNGFLSVCLLAALQASSLQENDRSNNNTTILSELAVTDIGKDHLELMRKTLHANKHIVSASNKTDDEKCEVSVVEHKWGEFLDDDTSGVTSGADNKGESSSSLEMRVQRGTGTFDFIFGSDLAYRDHLHAPLITSLQKFSHANTISLIGVTMNDTTPAFFTSLWEAGFGYERLGDHWMEPQYRGTNFGFICIQKRPK